MVPRPELLKSLSTSLRDNTVAVLLGPRQCGKTTLARQFAAEVSHEIFDLEDPRDLARLSSPFFALEELKGLVIIDEAQKKPELFSVLRVLADRPENAAKFLLLGSASPHLVRGVSESLAGRAALIEMSGFNILEVGEENYKKLWFRGGFPRSFLAEHEQESFQWRNNFIRTFLERDIPQLGISIPAERLRRFWTMIAHYHGQIFNSAEFARSLGTAENTVRKYLDLLSGAYVVRQLQPWHENIKKRQVKSPKIYIRDSGLLHALLSLETEAGIMGHAKFGASWEGFALEQVLAVIKVPEAYFWAVHAGAELDLFLIKDGERIGFEFKCGDAPEMTKSLQAAIDNLRLDRAYIIYPGKKKYKLSRGVEVLSIAEIKSI
ncbi:MAG: ATP-binding protein [Thermoguttaceae bacterium]